jgi:hypothetical protein
VSRRLRIIKGGKMIKNYNELDNEIRMLQGNINRMCVTRDKDELEMMFYFARIRINEIFRFNLLVLNHDNECSK